MSDLKFRNFVNELQKHFNEMTKDATNLFEVEIDKDEFWNLYLDSFEPQNNKIFRERREYDCSCCRHFIKTIGNTVVIKNNKLITLWDFDMSNTIFEPVVKALSEYIKSKVVSNFYVIRENSVGTKSNLEKLENGDIITWEHLYLDIPSNIINKQRDTIDSVKGKMRDIRNVFKRSLEEISEDSIVTVLELISQNSLYKGEEWKTILMEFLRYKKEYINLNEYEKELYAWEQSVKAGVVIGKIRNHSIGTLLTNITEGMNLDLAVKKYEALVAPTNYKRSKPIYTKKMLEDAKKKIEELGYMNSLKRRFANLNDITVNNIIYANRNTMNKINGDDIFSEMEKNVTNNAKNFSKLEEVSISDFINNVIPMANNVEVYLENKHVPNFVSLITSIDKESKSMFKWDNNFSWGYTGNITDSNVKENVKNAGGKVDGDLRFSIQWNECGTDNNDLDAHCIEPNGHEICFSSSKKPQYSPTKGQLDVDVIRPCGKIAVENITWANRDTMIDGVYEFYVHMFSGSLKEGFRAEIEFDGNIYSFDYPHAVRSGQDIDIAEVTLKNGVFTIKENLKSSLSSKEVWGLKTNEFVPVSTIMLSPNYWDEQKGIGNKHYFFMLQNCVNSELPNGFYNEFLNNELNENRKVFEALGLTCHVEDTENQLSGLGFSSTKRNELIVRVTGASKRVLKVKF